MQLGVIRVTNPDVDVDENPDELDGLKYGIADGGHTFEVIRQTIERAAELEKLEGWTEPYVRVHFLAGDAEALASGEIEQVVEALNTSSQVQQFTIDEYQNKFDNLKSALAAGGFDTSLIAFRENEEKEWGVREIIQSLGMFLEGHVGREPQADPDVPFQGQSLGIVHGGCVESRI